MRRFLISLSLLGLLAVAQAPIHLGLAYAPEPAPVIRLSLRRVRGLLRDHENLAIPGVALGLFPETAGHAMLAISVSDAHGKFDFGGQVPAGDYQLVAQYPGLCTAHVPVTVSPGAKNRQLVFEMTFPGLGACSSAHLK